MNRVWLIIFGDFIAFWISFLIVFLVRFGGADYQTAISLHFIPFIILYLFWTLSFYLFGLYDLFTIKPTIPHLRRFGMAISTSFVVGIFLFYFIPIFGISPKTNLVFQIIGFGLISFFIRRMIFILFSKTVTRSVIIIGKSQNIDEIKNVIANNPQLGLKLISHKDNSEEALLDYSDTRNAVFIFQNIPDEIPKESVLSIYKNNSEIINVAQAYERYLEKIPVSYVNQSWIIENINIKENIIYTIVKKIMDIIVASCVLIITSPILIISALLIYFYDHKTIFYIQRRVGLNGKIFKLYKLRSMIINSEESGAIWANKNDIRITPVGKAIRKLHFDEIPQMINIIKGDLSLVGPRPERPEFVAQLEGIIPHYELRHIIRPGFTGWAQIKYRYANTIDGSKEKFKYDLYYIKNRNFFLDIGIILKTIQIIFTH
jgi:exopolysaccharide biosynthesis polyprenyl glycosylphosphotransferase